MLGFELVTSLDYSALFYLKIVFSHLGVPCHMPLDGFPLTLGFVQVQFAAGRDLKHEQLDNMIKTMSNW